MVIPEKAAKITPLLTKFKTFKTKLEALPSCFDLPQGCLTDSILNKSLILKNNAFSEEKKLLLKIITQQL